MPDSINDLLQEYDDLAGVVASAPHGLYQMSLEHWFSIIDETPNFAREVSRLESINDFDAWYNDLHERQKKHGMGAPPFNLPTNREAAIGMQLALFRRMAQGKINPALFAHVFIAPHERNLTANVNELSRHFFLPTIRALRRILKRVGTEDDSAPDITSIAVPASNRVVSVDHNQPTYTQTIDAIDKLHEALRGENSFDDIDDKERCLAEIQIVPILLKPKRVRIALLIGVSGVFIYIAQKFADAMLGKLAGNAMKKLLELFPQLASFLG
jgi:hypothetical protein